VYRRLLDYYYDTELPIPAETNPVIRRLRLGSYSSLVGSILEEFFILECDGWHNYRADFEILAYKNKVDKAKENGKKGGRPKNINQSIGLETQSVILANPEITESKAKHKLLTINQEPLNNSKTPKSETLTSDNLVRDYGVSEQVAKDYMAIRKAKRSPLTKTSLTNLINEFQKSNLMAADGFALCAANGWVGFKSEWLNNRARPSQKDERGFIEKHTDRSWTMGLDDFMDNH